jgi:hypothetical protein
MYKILLNSPPRSGSAFLFSAARAMYSHDKRDDLDHMVSGEWHQTDNWIISAHEPVLFRGVVPDITMTTVLRDPIDTISSQILKSTYGFSNRTIAGKQEIVDAHMDFLKNKQEEYLQESLYQECRMWSGYTYGAMLAIDRIVPYTFEQVTQKTPGVLSTLYNIAGSSNNYREMDQQAIDEMITRITGAVQDDPAFSSGAANGLPTQKPEEYFIIREAVKKYSMIPAILDEYEKAKELFAKRQIDLGIAKYL